MAEVVERTGIEPEAALLVKVDEAARLLGLGRSSVYEMIQTGELPVLRFGRAVRVKRSDLERLIDRMVEQPA